VIVDGCAISGPPAQGEEFEPGGLADGVSAIAPLPKDAGGSDIFSGDIDLSEHPRQHTQVRPTLEGVEIVDDIREFGKAGGAVFQI
jgi:hypothetical protein